MPLFFPCACMRAVRAALMLLCMLGTCTAQAPRASLFFQIYNITGTTTDTHLLRALYGR